ncbi:DUF5811 family protein [Halanaeroarchaeum sulfurireducens]|uniref:Uncharacterized protein n=1 Tax=Halanaeroarchaeum sulfurireducens TaxID=1604004 RepID=A0A0F7PAN4_9EURY|nr:DUF5811 family protein [Halanaeroarchaeum sulfurireducens]AKH96684.1 hypothetical protein HLASF_0172 [Halanaeroarchaeum sulfurireducens]ALG81086.1 hypothetical protein HLASA_0172 [Halanaeroarchaeum sulfurireducens]
MNANTPYVGRPDEDTTDDAVDLTSAERRTLEARVSSVAARTRTFLPNEYVVGSRVGAANGGVRVSVSVRPPVGNPVSAGFDPDPDAEELISDEDVDEVARGLAASAALQVKRAVGDDISQTAQ